MEFLKTLQQIRTPFFDAVFSTVTYLGDEIAFMAVVLAVLWCFDKKWGYRLFVMGMAGAALNQLLKAIFIVPRPWVLDSAIKPLPSALGSATGYSFPSGHTQSAAGLFGGVAAWLKKWAVTAVCVFLVLLTAFSRMYLGVHTPLDVGVSLATGLGTVLLFAFFYRKAETDDRVEPRLFLAAIVMALLLLFYVLLAPKTENNVPQFDQDGVKGAYVVFGTMLGVSVAWILDMRVLRYDIRAAWWAQILKFALGLGLVSAMRAVLKQPLLALVNGHAVADCIRYFLMALTAGALWPLTFRFFAKTAPKREA